MSVAAFGNHSAVTVPRQDRDSIRKFLFLWTKMELCWDPFNSPLRVLLREFGWFESNFVIRVDVGEEERWHPFQGRAYPPFSVLTYRVIPFFVPPLASLL